MKKPAPKNASMLKQLAQKLDPEVQKSIETQLSEYIVGKRKSFDLRALHVSTDLRELKGTELQKSVWRELLKIPYGKTLTYSELAEKVGNPKAVRAIASSVARNPLYIIVPCHRVLPKQDVGTSLKKRVGNYALGSDMKSTLLEIEGAI